MFIKIGDHEYYLQVRYLYSFLEAVFRCLSTAIDLSSVGLRFLPTDILKGDKGVCKDMIVILEI